ncbi:MAG: Hsp20/alpha crystallin family protein [Lachnospiraceae bacterium]|nr:Hsp20/alpha crystallin family protein [Lachnospiraceae bacterium]
MLMPSIFGENLFDDFFDYPVRRRMPERRPAEPKDLPSVMKTDVREDEKGFELDIDLPGYDKKDVKAELKDGYLTVSAEVSRNNDEKDEGGRYIRRERYFGSCQRSFYVGEELTEEDIRAKFENGVLKIHVPKKEAKPKVEEKKIIAIEG